MFPECVEARTKKMQMKIRAVNRSSDGFLFSADQGKALGSQCT